jgi:hypothetical protein
MYSVAMSFAQLFLQNWIIAIVVILREYIMDPCICSLETGVMGLIKSSTYTSTTHANPFALGADSGNALYSMLPTAYLTNLWSGK